MELEEKLDREEASRSEDTVAALQEMAATRDAERTEATSQLADYYHGELEERNAKALEQHAALETARFQNEALKDQVNELEADVQELTARLEE